LWRLDDQQLSVEEEKKLISAAAKGDDLMEVDDDDGHDSESDEEDDEGNKVHKEKKKAKEESEKKKKTPKKDAKKTGRRKSLKALEKEAEVAEMQAKGAGPDPTTQRYMDPLEVLKHLERLWENNTPIMDLFWGGLYLRNGQKKRQSRPSQFFLRTLPVPPSRFRPAASFDGMLTEHSQSSYLSKIIQFVIDFKKTALEKEKPERTTKSRNVRMNEFWAQIQATANLYMDHETSDRDKNPSGIKQLLEKKQGLFRQNMMGKRVNYCARSVISPDPYLDTNEIGVRLSLSPLGL
jgi:DNA-directed RNA polymerase I subunit RPA1